MDPLFATGHLALWLLIGGLFFPRLCLFLAAFVFGGYPQVPALSDLVTFVLWLLVPRFLLAWYVYADMGMNNVWFWAYVITGILGLVGEPGYVRQRVIRRRTTITTDGTKTVEEIEE